MYIFIDSFLFLLLLLLVLVPLCSLFLSVFHLFGHLSVCVFLPFRGIFLLR